MTDDTRNYVLVPKAPNWQCHLQLSQLIHWTPFYQFSIHLHLGSNSVWQKRCCFIVSLHDITLLGEFNALLWTRWMDDKKNSFTTFSLISLCFSFSHLYGLSWINFCCSCEILLTKWNKKICNHKSHKHVHCTAIQL